MNVEFLPEITSLSTFAMDVNEEVPVASNFTHSVGSSVRFFCASSGNPLPTASWSVQKGENKTAPEYAHWTEEANETGKFLITEAGGRNRELVFPGGNVRKWSALGSKYRAALITSATQIYALL